MTIGKYYDHMEEKPAPAAGAPETTVDGELLVEFCRKFITDQAISCAETVYQTDRVIENAYEFIAGVCEIVGYHQDTD